MASERRRPLPWRRETRHRHADRVSGRQQGGNGEGEAAVSAVNGRAARRRRRAGANHVHQGFAQESGIGPSRTAAPRYFRSNRAPVALSLSSRGVSRRKRKRARPERRSALSGSAKTASGFGEGTFVGGDGLIHRLIRVVMYSAQAGGRKPGRPRSRGILNRSPRHRRSYVLICLAVAFERKSRYRTHGSSDHDGWPRREAGRNCVAGLPEGHRRYRAGPYPAVHGIRSRLTFFP